jgi:glucose/mannose-6-phosphate isomerase
MDLNDNNSFKNIDSQDYLSEIENLPSQLENAYQRGLTLELPAWQGIKHVLIAGVGGSAIGADLLAAYAAPLSPVPILVQRGYTLPAWATGPETLVIASSHSGNTEETLSAFEQALHSSCRMLALCTGGELARAAEGSKIQLWTFEHAGQPRAAVGFSFGLLCLAGTPGADPEPGDELAQAVSAMRSQLASLQADVPVVRNLAKREAGQLIGRMVMVFGAEVLEPVARRWKTQINELAKAWAQFEPLKRPQRTRQSAAA